MYTHTNHTRALMFDLEFERDTVNASAILLPFLAGPRFSVCPPHPQRSVPRAVPSCKVFGLGKDTPGQRP